MAAAGSKRKSVVEPVAEPVEAPAETDEPTAEEVAQQRAEEESARRETAALALYGHLRHTLGAEVDIDHARQIVGMVETALTPHAEAE